MSLWDTGQPELEREKERAHRKISLKNRKIIGRLGLRGFQPEMRGAALASLNKQFPFD